jgi:phage tail-like protein
MKRVFVVVAVLSLLPWAAALFRRSLEIEVAEAQARGGLTFRVEIDGASVGSFKSVSGLDSETEVVEYRDGTNPNVIRKLPGATKYPNIVLKKGITTGLDTIYEWRKDIESGREFKTKAGSIVILDDTKGEVVRYNFYEGWPCKWRGVSAVGNGSVIAIEEVELAVEKIVRS